MTEQLKQAERALDRMSGYMPQIYKDDLEIVRRALTQALCPPMTDELLAIRDANRYGWWVSTMFNKPSEVARILAPCTSPDEVDRAIDRAILDQMDAPTTAMRHALTHGTKGDTP